jgi:hypothetical protein
MYSNDGITPQIFDEIFQDESIPANVDFHAGHDVKSDAFGALLAHAPVILCPSRMEG